MTSPNLSSSDSFSDTLQPTIESDRSSGPKNWLIAGSIGILLLGGGFLLWRFVGARGQGGMQMPPGVAVGLDTADLGPVQDSSAFIGSLEAQTGVALQPEVSGRVAQVFVSAGDQVESGDAILLISPDQTQAQLDAAAANVTAARAARNSAESTLQSLRARQGELEAELTLEEAEFSRTESLVTQGAQSRQQLDVARRDLEVARAAVESARNEIAAAESRLAESAAALAQTQANQAAIQEDLQDRTVTAPIVGIVGDLDAKLGDYVTPSTVVTKITDNAELELDLSVPVEQRDRLRLGLPVELVSVDGTDVIETGSISFISPTINADTQTVLVKVRFDNDQNRLQDEQQVEARIIWSEDQGVLVPTSAITRLGGQTFVFVAEDADPEELPPPEAMPPGMPAPEQVARLRPVQLGTIQGNDYEILSGLEPGETIVVSGILNLQDGIPILPQSEAPSGEEAPANQAP
ncbi:efflux RND transporter periplasmic adaptor subunit [Oscillatoria sp. CS-180]|uniref:efflux RND transporter periplasmic adaptor subunit n=1 Tax=Oscillatoria sp. CS-180 TaxID=3021720 RepID=UPI00232ADDFE|nr:efflux RND transporter periplasmic adaptor subunit [Oscillatoria sp. CS-180]MDB9526608.1 efflux RND transporter periplasmic adaptor subunit [Oscillatoria sp. CS-180]